MTQNINQQSRLLWTLEEKGKSVFTISDAKSILKGTDSSVWHVLNQLVHKQRIHRIQRGRYLLIPSKAGVDGHWSEHHHVVIPYLIDTYYIGFWSAMSHWGMTEQIPYTVFIATTKRKRNLEFNTQKFKFVTLSKKKFFGFVEIKLNDSSFKVSSKEKTIIDGLTHPQYCGSVVEVTKAIWNLKSEINWDTVFKISQKIGVVAVSKRLGYLLSLLDIRDDISENIRHTIKQHPYHYLDPSTSKEKINYSKDFGLILNRSKTELLSWMDS